MAIGVVKLHRWIVGAFHFLLVVAIHIAPTSQRIISPIRKCVSGIPFSRVQSSSGHLFLSKSSNTIPSSSIQQHPTLPIFPQHLKPLVPDINMSGSRRSAAAVKAMWHLQASPVRP
jgi:hypothetical protein